MTSHLVWTEVKERLVGRKSVCVVIGMTETCLTDVLVFHLAGFCSVSSAIAMEKDYLTLTFRSVPLRCSNKLIKLLFIKVC